MTAPNTCGRCGHEERPDRLRLALVNYRKEAREDGRTHVGPDFGHDIRCKDRKACAERARRPEA